MSDVSGWLSSTSVLTAVRKTLYRFLRYSRNMLWRLHLVVHAGIEGVGIVVDRRCPPPWLLDCTPVCRVT